MEKPDVRALLQAGLRRFRGARDEGHAPGDRQARVVAIAARKGGVGKTTTAVNLAAALVEAGQSVFLADLDPQGHVASALREVARTGPVTLSEVLLADRPRDVLDAAVQSGLPGLWLTPPDKGLGDAEARLTGRVGRETILQAAMGTARTHYDTILLDCPHARQPHPQRAAGGGLGAGALRHEHPRAGGVADLLESGDRAERLATRSGPGRAAHPGGRPQQVPQRRGGAGPGRQLRRPAPRHGDPGEQRLAAAQSAGQSIFTFRPRSSGPRPTAPWRSEVGRRAG
ncbi:MAG: AAA family ATPase [bacterium]